MRRQHCKGCWKNLGQNEFYMKYFARLSIAFLTTLLWIFPVSVWPDDDVSANRLSGSTRAGAQSVWKHFSTKRTVVYYQTEAKLESLNRKLKLGRSAGFLGLFAGKESGSIAERLERKIDQIFENAQTLLDMHNCKSKIKIMVHADQNEVDQSYSNLVSKYNLSSLHTDYIAFYFHKLKTVYISLETVTEGVMAHELAHAIIDHYFIIRPPSKVAEMLARYVDKHLERD